MYISFLCDIRFRRKVLILIFFCAFTFTSLSSGNCDDWVYVGFNDYFSIYYNISKIIINQKSKQIKVWIKMKYTDKGKDRYIMDRKREGLEIIGYHNLSDTIHLFLYDYDRMQDKILYIVDYSISGEVLSRDEANEAQWHEMIPESVDVRILNRILKDHNIHR